MTGPSNDRQLPPVAGVPYDRVAAIIRAAPRAAALYSVPCPLAVPRTAGEGRRSNR
ncbi:hypothetical protein [Streptomyces sp. NPDC059828]|uniref:hypothetical protein n=1 Tax=Streptomyces sp. NPDC059828 TaxID=3346965 RepID=UPI003651A2A2